MSIPPWNFRGSEWHRWDPHIHAPGTVLEDYFKDDWDGYLDRIETAAPQIRALGVTDYFCINTYKQVRARKNAGRLPNVELIFPNVEIRLDMKTSREKGINLHLLFSPDDPNHESEIERILGRLFYHLDGRDYACSRGELIALGRKYDSNQTDDNGAFRTGVEQFKVNMDALRRVFKDDAWLEENCLVAVASGSGDGVSGLQGDDAFRSTREEIQRRAHIMFSSQKADRDFWLGLKTGADRKEIERLYRGLKPCLHGCDAHSLERVGAPVANRYCWIKGDFSFETLRQAVIDPEERVIVSETPPIDEANSVTIRQIRPIGTPWLKGDELEFNRGLVSIIGERGSGKTALVDLIAAGADAMVSNPGESSFLKRASSPVDLIGDAKVEEIWADGEKYERPFCLPEEWDEPTPLVRYLSQQFVDRLCSASGLAVELRQEIEKVIFDQSERRLETDSFNELSELLLKPIRRRREQHRTTITTSSTKMAEEARQREQLPKVKKDHSDLAQQIAKSRGELEKLLPKGQEEKAKLLLALDEARTALTSRIEALLRQIKALTELGEEVSFIEIQETAARLRKLQEDFSEAGLNAAQWEQFRLIFSGTPATVIAGVRKGLEAQIGNIQNGDPEKPVDIKTAPPAGWPLTVVKTAAEALQKEIVTDNLQRRKYETLKKTITTNEGNLRKLAAVIEKATGAEARMRELRDGRREAYREVIQTFVEERNVLEELYAPLHKELEEEEGALAKLRFSVKRHVYFERWIQKGKALLDLRVDSSFRGHNGLEDISRPTLLAAWQSGSAEVVAAALHSFVEKYYKEFLAAAPPSIEPPQREDWIQHVGAWLYDTAHLEIQYGIEYGGVAVEQLSPGTRGIVLLLLYLAIDKTDRRPLLIDQPEENLDPKSVFDDLVPHFRKARKRRQVIIVTHNANLVVNTDADQVIVASSEAGETGTLPTITYKSGSLENPDIREAVCRILEGGKRAFLERERRYRIHWRDLFDEKAGERE